MNALSVGCCNCKDKLNGLFPFLDYGYDLRLGQTERNFLGKNSSLVTEKTVLLGAVDDGSSYVVSRHDYQLQSVKDSKEDLNSNVYREKVSSLIALTEPIKL